MFFTPFLLLSLIICSYSINCGEYTTSCIQAGSIYVQYSYVISVDSDGGAKKIIQTERQYTDSNCEKNEYLSFETQYSPSLLHRENDLYEEYNLKYNSVTMTVEDADLFSSLGFTCNKSIKSGKSFNVQKISCDQANLPYTPVYANSIGTTVENVRIRLGDDVIYMMDLEAHASGIAGCTTKIALITIISIVVVVALVAIVFIWICKKKSSRF